jgi:predicted dehydrogenase
MNGGARVLYNGSWCAKGQFCDWNGNWQIECERGTVTYQHGKITLYSVPEMYNVKETRDVPIQPMELQAQSYVLDEFMRCAKARAQPATSGFDNIKSVAMVFATVRSMDSGRRVPVLDDGIRELIA